MGALCLLQLVDGAMEVEVLMKRMAELQQQQEEEEECSQEEMVTRFERERSESIPTGTHTRHRRATSLLQACSLHWLLCVWVVLYLFFTISITL